MEAIRDSVEKNKIEKISNFLWPVPAPRDILRKRSFNINPERICDEEIMVSIRLVLKRQHATSKDDLIVEAAKNIGIKRITNNAKVRFSYVIDRLIESKELTLLRNGMIDLTNS